MLVVQGETSEREEASSSLSWLASLEAIWRPVAATMVIASVLVVVVANDETPTVTEDDEGELAQGLANAGLAVGVVLLATIAMLSLYRAGCVSLLRCYMLVSLALLLGVAGAVVAVSVLAAFAVRADAISVCLVSWNVSCTGVLAIFAPEPFGFSKAATSAFLVATAVAMAWQLAFFYPPTTTWCALVALAAYDAFAVLAPCGPLRLLVGLMARTEQPLPGLLYEAEVEPENPNGPTTVKLGLGDFVFYSVLVSQAADRDLPAAAACFVATLFGLALTLLLLAVTKRPLPALPISIVLGVCAFFATDDLLRPLIAKLKSLYV